MNDTRHPSTAGETSPKEPHGLTATDRREITVTGVQEVDSFDEHTVVLVTTCGRLALEGEDLRVRDLDTEKGRVLVTGRLTGLLYDDETPAQAPKRRRPRLLG